MLVSADAVSYFSPAACISGGEQMAGDLAPHFRTGLTANFG